MSRSFIDEMKYIVQTPSEWPHCGGSIAVCNMRYSEVRDNFLPPPPDKVEEFKHSIFGVKIHVDDSVPPNEIRFVSWVRDPVTNEYKPRVDRIINVSVP